MINVSVSLEDHVAVHVVETGVHDGHLPGLVADLHATSDRVFKIPGNPLQVADGVAACRWCVVCSVKAEL